MIYAIGTVPIAYNAGKLLDMQGKKGLKRINLT
jgi:hypothetical protein